MNNLLEKIFVIEGILFGVLGLLFIFNPVDSLIVLTNVTGLILISIGILYLIRDRKNIIMSVIDIILGIGLIAMPAESVTLIVAFYGAWSVVRGIYILIDGIKNDMENKFSIIYSAVIILLGLVILLNPIVSFISVPYVIGTYFIVSSLSELYIGFMLK